MSVENMEYTAQDMPERPKKTPEEVAENNRRLTEIEQSAPLRREGEEEVIRASLSRNEQEILAKTAREEAYFRENILKTVHGSTNPNHQGK